jgi:hypothetical protein
MSYFHNKKSVWEHINNQINSESRDYFERNYTHKNFLKDFERSSGKLCIHGKPAEPILNAKKQIAVMERIVQAIEAAVVTLKESPESMDLAYLKMISEFNKETTDQLETTLESVILIIKKLEGMDASVNALQTLVPILNSVARDANRTQDQLLDVSSIPENFSQTLRDAGSPS